DENRSFPLWSTVAVGVSGLLCCSAFTGTCHPAALAATTRSAGDCAIVNARASRNTAPIDAAAAVRRVDVRMRTTPGLGLICPHKLAANHAAGIQCRVDIEVEAGRGVDDVGRGRSVNGCCLRK